MMEMSCKPPSIVLIIINPAAFHFVAAGVTISELLSLRNLPNEGSGAGDTLPLRLGPETRAATMTAARDRREKD
jgi:hypothetical protein